MSVHIVDVKFNRNLFLRDTKQKVDGILKNRKNVNDILDIIDSLKDDRSTVPCLQAVSRIFCTLLSRGDMVRGMFHVEGAKDEENEAEVKYRTWIIECYKDVTEILLEFLHHSSTKVRHLSLTTLMKFISLEGQHPFNGFPSGRTFYFPENTLQKVLKEFVSDEHDMRSDLNMYFHKYVQYVDVALYSWKALPMILKNLDSRKKPKDVSLGNVEVLLKQIFATTFNRDDNKQEGMELLCLRENQSPEETGVTVNKKWLQKHLTQIWDIIKNWKVSATNHRHLVVLVVDNIMVHIEQPLQLTDFLMDTFHMGGAVSLIALKGIFYLMDKHNLEYPEFYPKLYSMLNLDILHMKYKARFFYLLDLFLTSTYLPEYLVAAFTKRLARLLLAAPTNCQMMLLAFICNLLIRHSGLKVLIDRSSGATDEITDPFLDDEKDPAKCRALESSLWELQTMKSHILPKVSAAAVEVKLPLPKVEMDVSMMLETSFPDIFEAEMKKFHKNIPTNHKRPSSLALPDEADRFSKYWRVS